MSVKRMQGYIFFLHLILAILGVSAVACFWVVLPNINQIICQWKTQSFYSRKDVEELKEDYIKRIDKLEEKIKDRLLRIEVNAIRQKMETSSIPCKEVRR